LMIVSRSRFFDNWNWPPSLIVINTCGLGLVFWCAAVSRRTARRGRANAVKQVSTLFATAEGLDASTERPNAVDLRKIREAIHGIRSGAYGTLAWDPSVLAVLIPSGGYALFMLVFQLLLGLG